MEENRNLNEEAEVLFTDAEPDGFEAEACNEIELGGSDELNNDAELDKLYSDGAFDGAEDGISNPTEEPSEDEKPEYVPKNKYESVLYRVYRDEGFSEILRVASLFIVALTVYAFFVHLLRMLEPAPLAVIELLIITGVPFVALSVMRRLINAPRPYELLEFYEKKPKGKSGCSFPSRHVFSVFVIASVIVPTNIALGITLFILGAVLGAMRVLLGVHFIRDVVAGALIGAVSGAIGLLTLFLI